MDPIQIRTTKLQASRGIKRTCLEMDCGERFYDLNKESIVCPYCGMAHAPAPKEVLKPKARAKTRHYRLEKPQPTFLEAEEKENEDRGPSDTDSLEDEVEDSGGATSLLESDDSDDESSEVARSTLTSDD